MMNNAETKMGMLGGISFSLIGQIQTSVLQTIFLAAIGAVVSFAVSRLLQWLLKPNQQQ